jgi:plastocyanin
VLFGTLSISSFAYAEIDIAAPSCARVLRRRRRAATEDSSPDAGHKSECTATIALLDYKLDPKAIDADSGPITLCTANKGQAPHDLAVRDATGKTLGRTMVLQPNAEDTFTVDLKPGTYTIYCTQGGHESLGMKGTLTVH